MKTLYHLLLPLLLINLNSAGQRADYITKNYTKKEVYIPMRDGIRLYTAIYTPKDSLKSYPILFSKTPYGIKPYARDSFPGEIGPSAYLEQEKYIFVHQDARGMFMSEGRMEQMTPHLPIKPDSSCTDNSTDTYDAVEWLLKNTRNNGRVGLWGISYRGFYASSGIIDAHPAIKCSSPQAPIADWFIGDDMHHHGAFALMPGFNFFEAVGQTREETYTKWPGVFNYPVRDAYNFFLNIGRLSNINQEMFMNKVPFWDSICTHPDYDRFWQSRNILPHLNNISPEVMVTGGLFDHENLYGSLQTYRYIKQNSNNITRLVLGPWIHGGWARTTGDALGDIDFGSPTSDFYQRMIEAPFFNHHLKQKALPDELPAVAAFTTGTNTWEYYDNWPPEELAEYTLYLQPDQSIEPVKPAASGFVADKYTSDPAHPVPYTQVFHTSRFFYNKNYMVEDQRFASARPDVLSYTTQTLDDTVVFQGPVFAELYVSSTSKDYDLVVKVIDEYPDTFVTSYANEAEPDMAGYQQLVRAEIFRAKYRNDYEHPEAILPGKIEHISIPLNDINHAFLPGHRVMIQIQSSLFPLYDRNPQIYMNIYNADEEDFKKADIQIYRSRDYPSHLKFGLKISDD